jgi:hypothetical protein
MRIVLIADEAGRDRARELAVSLDDARVLDAPEAPEPSPTGSIAAALVAFERELSGDPPELVALVGDGDVVLAGVLVAAKLGLAMFRVEDGPPTNAKNAEILAILVSDSGERPA